MTVHSRSTVRGTSLSRDDDGRDCGEQESAAENAERLHVRRSTKDNSNVRNLLAEAAGAAYKFVD